MSWLLGGLPPVASSQRLEGLERLGQPSQLGIRVFALRGLGRKARRRSHVILRAEQCLSRSLVASTRRSMGVQRSERPPRRVLAPAANDPPPLPLRFFVEGRQDLTGASGDTRQ